MKFFRQFTFAILLLSTASLLIHAQPAMKTAWAAGNDTVPAGKVALVDTRLFYDQKAGIQKLINAYKQLEAEFAPRQAELQIMQNRIVAMNAEINKMGATPAAKAKEEELVRLQRDFTYQQQEAEAAVNRRRLILVQPIHQQLAKALQEFIAARGIALLLDTSKLEGVLLAALPTVDVTQAFINDFNLKNPAPATATARQ